ncbi:MAG: family 43 glycosylhydrolase [Lachnospiraceae bacterium]|nr:family 43 glycosylhydrolase [Lachnospiraceae bacterium]
MRNKRRKGWKQICSIVLASAMLVTAIPADVHATTSSVVDGGLFTNPVIYSDVPDMDMIRVGDTYYMVSTTMHLSPGCPIMKSTDLVNWEIVNYVYDRLGTEDAMSLRNGKEMYGNGQWASSLNYHNGKYYVAFNSNTTGRAYIFTTEDIENGAWEKTELPKAYHDMALFFDDDSTYILYGGTDIKYVEMNEDLTDEKEGGQSGTLFSCNANGEKTNSNGYILGYEGTHIMKKDGYYYVFNICWPKGGPRTEVCHRSKNFPSTEWENEVILSANFTNNGVSGGVAQGGVIDTADGKWYGYLFQDHGAVGRVPVLTDCTWKDGWPMLGKDGDGKTVEAVMELPIAGGEEASLVKSDEFYNDAEHRVFDAAKQTVMLEKEINAVSYAGNQISAIAEDAEKTEEIEVITNGNFEDGLTGWESNENGKAVIAKEEDNSVLFINERVNTSSSMRQDLSGMLEKGQTYTISGKLKYEDGPATKRFNVMLQNGVDYRYRVEAGSVTANKGEWTPFSFTYVAADKSEEFPFDPNENYLFIETPWTAEPTIDNDLMNFYLDDLSMTFIKTGSAEEGETVPENLIQLITNGGAESGDTTGWTSTPGEQAAALEVVTDEKASGDSSLYVTNRKGTGAGACQDISGQLVMGKEYTISGKLKYTDGPDTKKFYVTIQNGENYNWRENLVTINARKGQWVEFSGTYIVHDKSEQFPFDPTQNYIFVETPWTANQDATNDLMNYYLDDFSMTTKSDDMILNGSFEKGLENWEGFENAKINTTTEEAQDGTTSVVTTERSACAQGPSQDLSNKLTAGNIYTATAYVKYNTGVDTKTFNLTIQNGPDYRYRTVLGSVTAKKGEWTKLEVKYVMPEDAITTQNYLFVETPWVASPTKENDLMDFYVDNISMIEQIPAEKEVEQAGENDYNGSNLDLVWQWNHNPNNNNWSLTDRSGWLRLTTGNKVSGLLEARNTLTQRTYGPTCAGKIKMDISNMKPGDVAGLASLSYNYGYIAVEKDAEGAKLVMVDASENSAKSEDAPQVIESVPCEGNIVYLKEEFNFAGNEDGADKDTVSFYYSFDGNNWSKLGNTMKLTYELVHFMGSRFAIFNYATKSIGGFVDYDYFRVSDEITGESKSEGSALTANITGTKEMTGVVNQEGEMKVYLDALAAGNHTSINASIAIPELLEVKNVIFNTAAIKGEASYSYKNNRLILNVKGKDVSFGADDKLFATIQLKVKNYAAKDEKVVVKPDYIMIDNGKAEYDLSACQLQMEIKHLDTKALAKELGYGNPIMTQEFGADPYAIVYDGRVYVYMTADDYQYDENGNVIDNNFGYIRSLRVVSSDDMLNWTDHGAIKVAGEDGAAKWAAHSWAPAIAYKQIDGKDKFFLYFANDASGIGVLEADTPLGPWTDPIGKALITRQTPGCAGVVWCFDLAVLVDDDGSAYIYFGGGVPDGQQLHPNTARVAKLGEDMISIEGEAKLIDAPCMFEDAGIFKFGDTYYYTYCSNFSGPHGDGYPGFGTICYMESKNPMGPFEYKGEIFQNPTVWFGVGGNNHHATFVFEGETYFIYHAQTVSKALGIEKGYRSTHIDSIEFNSDGSIKPIKGTYAGIDQLRDVSAYERIDAETIAWNAGIQTEECKEPGKLFADYNMNLTELTDGDWTSVAQVNFGDNGAKAFKVSAASQNGGNIEVRLDSPNGELIGTAEIAATGDGDTYKEVSCEVANVTGVRNIFLVFKGEDTKNIMNVDYYLFEEAEAKKPDDKPVEDNPSKDNPSEEKPSENKPSENKPADNNTTNTPSDNKQDEEQALAKYVGKALTSKNITYKVTKCTTAEKAVTVTGAKKQLKTITIPNEISYAGMAFKVTAISKNAFKNQKKLKSVTVGKYVESIGAKAFYNAKKLAKVKFKGTQVKTIGKNAFAKIKKNATFDVNNKKIKYYKQLLKKAKTKNYKVK